MKPKRAFKLVSKVQVAKLLMDPTRSRILSLLSERPMIGAELARTLEVAPSTVSSHLNLLRRNRVVKIARIVREPHGIPQKYFDVNAVWFLGAFDGMTPSIRAAQVSVHRERLRGVFSALQVMTGVKCVVESAVVEDLARNMSSLVTEIVQGYSDKKTTDNADTLIVNVFAEALVKVITKGESESAHLLRKAFSELKPAAQANNKNS